MVEKELQAGGKPELGSELRNGLAYIRVARAQVLFSVSGCEGQRTEPGWRDREATVTSLFLSHPHAKDIRPREPASGTPNLGSTEWRAKAGLWRTSGSQVGDKAWAPWTGGGRTGARSWARSVA